MKRATLLVIALAVLSMVPVAASVKTVPQDPKRLEAPASGPTTGEAGAAAQDAQPVAAPHAAAPASEGHAPAAPAAQGDAGHAAQGGHGGEAAHEAHEGESVWSTVARWFNFALLAGTLIYLLRSPFAEFLETRKGQIRKDLTDAAEMRENAGRQLAVIDRKLQALPGELDALKQRGIAEIAAEEGRIRQAAEAERQRLLEAAGREIDRRGHLAERRLLQRAGDLAVRVATERVQRSITDADQQRLIERYLDQVRPETLAS